MKKSLLVLAVAAAVPVLAQAQTNVTMYGRVDASIASEARGGGAGSAISLLSGNQSSNRWGVRGSEDLGGGLKAIFNLEAGFDADIGRGLSAGGAGSNANTAGGLDFRRRSVVGLEGGFGTLVFGRDYDPLFRVLLGSDTLGLGHYSNVHTIFGTGYGVRIDNGLHYVSPSLGGLRARLAYGFSEVFATTTAVNKNTGTQLGAALEYAAGPLYVGLGYRANQANTSATAIATGMTSVTNKFTALGARYNFGAFAINAGIGRADPAGAANNTKSMWLGGDVQAGPGRLHVQFGSMDPDGAGKATSLGVTYNYPLSKRTNAYATIGQVKNNASGNFNLTTSSTTVIPGIVGADPRGIAFGVGHNF